ncbi:glioma pathogenesis-related protein 1 [Patella vulgata]|uniref:glioma pathogenesis-related protein 1 n=1 Tax=Patella vulgata TaxID=6465 RepID=UPI00217F76C1|nr:glioma pathogenesis-related protein 1 [Patella vulgata]
MVVNNNYRLTSRLAILFSVLSVVYSYTGLADIRAFHRTILERHNEYRRNQRASNMREMEWDESLAIQASTYAQQCNYQRPKRSPDHGENLHFESGYVKSWHSIRKSIRRSMNNWHREMQYFRYGRDCGSACSFVQMILADSYKVGCGLNRCRTMTYGRTQRRHVSLFVCFYAPKGQLIGDYPFKRGPVCSQCPRGTQCRQNLCSNSNSAGSPSNIIEPNPPKSADSVVGPILPDSGPLSSSDQHYLVLVHNRMRERRRLPELTWSSILELWASYVIRCDTEYPGPETSYSNFGKIDRSQPVYQLVYEWGDEGDDVYIHLESGCRTPSDSQQCNHNTNIMERSITRIGCAAMACGRKRQLTCIYDNRTI